MTDKIRALFIFEILGRPPEHIKITLEQLIDRIGENPGMKILNRKVHEPHPIDKNKEKKLNLAEELFSTFAEVELEVDDLPLIFSIVLNMLPSNIEIIEPSEFKLKNFDLTSVLNELSLKLHRYDEIAKITLLEKRQMENKIKELENKINKTK